MSNSPAGDVSTIRNAFALKNTLDDAGRSRPFIAERPLAGHVLPVSTGGGLGGGGLTAPVAGPVPSDVDEDRIGVRPNAAALTA